MGKALILTPLTSTQFPKYWRQSLRLKDGTLALIRFAELRDAFELGPYFAEFTDQELYFRFFSHMRREALCRDRAIGFYRDALDNELCRMFVVVDKQNRLLGVCRAMEYVDGHHSGTGAFEVSFSARKKGNGVGSILMRTLLLWAEATEEVRTLHADVLHENTAMLRVFRRNGFSEGTDPDNRAVRTFVRAVRLVTHKL